MSVPATFYVVEIDPTILHPPTVIPVAIKSMVVSDNP
jgi:hypothetical protein